jgi:CBS domain containing-hemolysin-like protein
MESTKHDVKIQYKKIVIVTDSKKHPIGIMSLKDMIKFVISDKTDRDLHENTNF